MPYAPKWEQQEKDKKKGKNKAITETGSEGS
jgi:hypothetical protein